MKIGIIEKEDDIDRKSEIMQICEIIKNNNATVYFTCNKIHFDDAIILSQDEFYQTIDLLIILGGDGTLLRAAKYTSEYDIPILGINFGRIGFLTDLEKNNISLIETIFNGNYLIDERAMIDASITKNGESLKTFRALNDVVISRGNFSKMIDLDLYIDQAHFSELRADGLIICTPTGSTAYSLSAGGAVIDPTSELIGITPICAHTLKSRPLIVNQNRKIKIKHREAINDLSYIAVDGDFAIPFEMNCDVDIKISDKKVKLIRIINRNFYAILKEKV
jgi:NAD+ kinase